jgi:hypothetical protein
VTLAYLFEQRGEVLPSFAYSSLLHGPIVLHVAQICKHAFERGKLAG